MTFWERFLFLKKGDAYMGKKLAPKMVSRGYKALVVIYVTLMLSIQTAYANNTIWTRISDAVRDVYGQILGISTIIAVTAAAIALIVRMVSRNQRAVDEASTWLKRILLTWLILNSLGFIISYLQGFIAGGQFTM